MESSRGSASSFQRSIYFKLLTIGFLMLILQIPIEYIQSLISERIQTKNEAEEFIARLSGRHQSIVPPVLAIPYTYRYLDEKQREKSYRSYTYILPDTMHVSGAVDVERRHRGIFELPVYTSKLTIYGSYLGAKVSPPDVADQDILWAEAMIIVGITDPRTIRDASKLSWDNQHHEPEPGVIAEHFGSTGIHYPIPGLSAATLAGQHRFSLELTVGGSQTLNFLPVGRTTEISLTSSWPHPSFSGNYLPTSREVGEKGFTATWKILDLGRSFPRFVYGSEQSETGRSLSGSQFGVGFYAPVDAHRMSDRALKYELFAIGLTFLVFAMFELFCKLQIHSIQYLLIGAALVLFYLLLLSLSEHLGFSVAYFLASLLVLALVMGYSRSVLRRSSGAATVGLALGLLYGFFFTLLQEDDYSLLIGTLGLTSILGAVMYFTRNIDWARMSLAPQREVFNHIEAEESLS